MQTEDSMFPIDISIAALKNCKGTRRVRQAIHYTCANKTNANTIREIHTHTAVKSRGYTSVFNIGLSIPVSSGGVNLKSHYEKT